MSSSGLLARETSPDKNPSASVDSLCLTCYDLFLLAWRRRATCSTALSLGSQFSMLLTPPYSSLLAS